MQPERGPEGGGHIARGAQRIGHQRAAAGAAFHQQHGIGAAHPVPDHGGPGAQHLPEGLADLGRRGEVAAPAEGGGGACVIGRDRAGHEAVEAFHSAARHAVAARFDRVIRNSPTAIIGSDSNCPMVAPAKRKPRCASGWRKNSPMKRATP